MQNETFGILYTSGWYKAVQLEDGMYWDDSEPVLVRTLIDTRPYEKPQNGAYQLHNQKSPMAVHTGMYWYVLSCTCTVQGGTRWYKVVQDGTTLARWYKQQYMEVQGGTRPYENSLNPTGWYIRACTDPYDSIWVCRCPAAGFAAAILPGR